MELLYRPGYATSTFKVTARSWGSRQRDVKTDDLVGEDRKWLPHVGQQQPQEQWSLVGCDAVPTGTLLPYVNISEDLILQQHRCETLSNFVNTGWAKYKVSEIQDERNTGWAKYRVSEIQGERKVPVHLLKYAAALCWNWGNPIHKIHAHGGRFQCLIQP